VCVISAGVFLWMWPWQPAAGHLAALALFGLALAELALSGTQKTPFTCSYLPGRSHLNVAIVVLVMLVIPMTVGAARLEREALQDPIFYGAMMSVLAIAWLAARGRTVMLAAAEGAEPAFEEESADAVLTLEVWDSRHRGFVTSRIDTGVSLTRMDN
jgi:hypothetical protein